MRIGRIGQRAGVGKPCFAADAFATLDRIDRTANGDIDLIPELIEIDIAGADDSENPKSSDARAVIRLAETSAAATR